MLEPNEIKIGPFVFEYDGRGMGVGDENELRGYAEPVRPAEWAEFIAASKSGDPEDEPTQGFRHYMD